MARTLQELMELARTNPGELTPAKLDFLRKQKARAERAAKRKENQRLWGDDWNKNESLKHRSIKPISMIKDAARKSSCAVDFRLFCETYFKTTFSLSWSADHLKIIGYIQYAVLNGGQFALAMPRGSGKTSLCETACIWAILYGYSDFVFLIAATAPHAKKMLKSIKSEFERNDLLCEDFPEVCEPIRALEGINRRAAGQLLADGSRTAMSWKNDEAIFPTVPGSLASGAMIISTGITSCIRGQKFKRPDGRPARPSLIVIDDPQTDESAKSISQNAERESILAGAIGGLSEPGKKIAMVMPCTVIQPSDMIDQMLKKELHPEWNGERTKMLYSFPQNEKLWERYKEIRIESLRVHRDIRDATEFYRQNQVAMDEGAKVAWKERFKPDEISAIQHAMNLYFANERAFMAEYQNDPMAPEVVLSPDALKPDDVMLRLSGLPRGMPPESATHLVGFIDCGADKLHFCLAAFAPGFTGAVIDYGHYPRGTEKLRDKHKEIEAAIYEGLKSLCGEIIRPYGHLSISRLHIDAGYFPRPISRFIESAKNPALCSSVGIPIGPDKVPISEWQRKPNERAQFGIEWKFYSYQGIPRVGFDADFWKTFSRRRLLVSLGESGAVSLFQASPSAHYEFACHIAQSERPEIKTGKRTVQVWRPVPGQENHYLDCFVGCFVAASVAGIRLEFEAAAKREPKRMSLAALQKGKK